MSKKNLTQPTQTVQTVTSFERMSNGLDGLLMTTIDSYSSGIAARAITPNDIKPAIIAQIRNRVKDLWAMAAATGDKDEAGELLDRAARFTAKLPFEAENAGEEAA